VIWRRSLGIEQRTTHERHESLERVAVFPAELHENCAANVRHDITLAAELNAGNRNVSEARSVDGPVWFSRPFGMTEDERVDLFLVPT
jgi:hypothetical protein